MSTMCIWCKGGDAFKSIWDTGRSFYLCKKRIIKEMQTMQNYRGVELEYSLLK